jgi:hypothetical protein
MQIPSHLFLHMFGTLPNGTTMQDLAKDEWLLFTEWK